MIPIVEMFYSIQGEGPRIVPAVFVRSALCNFTCEGFGCSLKAPDGSIVKGCDSIRAVSPKFKENWTNYINYEDLVEDIDKIMPEFSKHNIFKPDIVWTGGEPLIYWKDEVMQRTLSHYISRGHKVTIETNASLDIDFFRKYQEQIAFSMSVKLSNSGEPEHKRINIETITKILENCPDSYLKFVVSKATWEQDWKEIRAILKSIPVFAKVYFMPMGESQEELQKNTRFVVERAAEYGMGYTDRIHIRAWNTEPGR
jgi:7-carboxy-7-deazaguanine synthase